METSSISSSLECTVYGTVHTVLYVLVDHKRKHRCRGVISARCCNRALTELYIQIVRPYMENYNIYPFLNYY
jgi:hypothetical protein